MVGGAEPVLPATSLALLGAESLTLAGVAW